MCGVARRGLSPGVRCQRMGPRCRITKKVGKECYECPDIRVPAPALGPQRCNLSTRWPVKIAPGKQAWLKQATACNEWLTLVSHNAFGIDGSDNAIGQFVQCIEFARVTRAPFAQRQHNRLKAQT